MFASSEKLWFFCLVLTFVEFYLYWELTNIHICILTNVQMKNICLQVLKIVVFLPCTHISGIPSLLITCKHTYLYTHKRTDKNMCLQILKNCQFSSLYSDQLNYIFIVNLQTSIFIYSQMYRWKIYVCKF